MVLFDCDGVLVDSEPVTNRLLQANLAARGLDVSHEQIITLFVGGTILGVSTQAAKMGATLEPNWVDRFYAQMFETLARDVTLIPGVLDVLDELDTAGIPYAVCSNGPHAKMNITLNACGLKERFSGRIYSREDVTTPKPAPDVYLHAAAQAGIAPHRCVVVEDSPSGAKAGIAAGMATLGFVRETDPGRMAPICDALFDDMGQLPTLLKLSAQARALT
ncbi:HAD family hydrolase [Shimia sp. SK013]|uniref:HAD family hydrolase n=1 Tax=Shimia sp. SK013 TaxID=1389006 RepID=UPI001F4D2919|nr:HAD family phosphatase [Shimia sp. SK013]